MSASGSPRSRNTLPLPLVTFIGSILFARPVILLGVLEPLFHQVNVALGCLYSFFRFLLEGMERIDHSGKAHGINGSVRISIEVLNHLDDRCTMESLKRLRLRMSTADLRHMKGVADDGLNPIRKFRKIIERATHEADRLSRLLGCHVRQYPNSGIFSQARRRLRERENSRRVYS